MDFKSIIAKLAEVDQLDEAKKTAKRDDHAEKAGKKVTKDIEYDEKDHDKIHGKKRHSEDEKAEKAGKKVAKDIEYDEKKDKKKKSLKDWMELIDKGMLAEAEQIQMVPAKQNTQVIKQGNKTLGTVSNPQLAAQIKQSIGKGEMSLAGTEMKEAEMDESGLQAYLGKKKYGKEGMAALQKAGRDGASKEKMAKIRAHHDKLDEVEMEEATGDYSAKKARAGKDIGKPGKQFSKIAKSAGERYGSKEKGEKVAGAVLAKLRKANEAEIPSSGPDYGAGLGAGRNQSTFEGKKPDFLDLDKDGNKKESMKKAAADKKKKKVDEAMNTLEAAYHEGKSHGLSKHSYSCRYDEGTEEHRRYHDGFKEGLDECYGLMPNRGLVDENIPATVPGMASQAMTSMPAMEADVDEGNAFTAALAKTKKGDSFSVGGKTFTDRSNYDSKIDEFAFESLDKQLNDLLNEGTEVVNEGLSVNMSQGLGGAGSEDSVSVTAQGDDAAKLLDFIKQVGLGGLGGAEAAMNHGEPAVVATVSDYGAPKFSGHDGMAELMKKVGVDDGADDYKQEAGADHEHSESCGCEKVDEVETEDQREFQVAEDDGEGYEQSQADAGKIDSALALSGASKGGATNEGGDGGEASEETPKDTAGDAGEGGVEDASDEQEALSEWANDAGKNGTDTTFERDIEFMTKVISGGLNKPKSTGQTTIPVIAGQEDRMGVTEDSDVSEWKRLAGIK
jgi:hypothetical protein